MAAMQQKKRQTEGNGYGVLHMKVKLIIHLIDLYTF